jgi:hypothetical protein
MAVGYNPSIVSDGLVYYLDPANTRCYGGSGNTANGLIGGINGTLVNGVGFTSSNNGSFFFDGTNDYINTNQYSSSIGLTSSDFTICLWTKIVDNNQFNAFVSRTYSNLPAPLDMYTHTADRKMRILVGNTSAWVTLQSNNQLPLAWTYLTFTLNSILASLYYNAVLDISTNMAAVRIESANPIIIGTRDDNFTHMKGNIGQVQIYNRALSQQEILQNFNATRFRYGV